MLDKTEKKYLVLGIAVTAALLLFAALIIAACAFLPSMLVLFVASLGYGDVTVYSNESLIAQSPSYDGDESWAVYWYICGSDLESVDGAASDDIYELLSVPAYDDLTVVMQTGGADKWNHPSIDAELSQRFVYDKNGFRQVYSEGRRNMGNPSLLMDFLSFCEREYPADHRILILWNHGGGSIGGIAYDEQYLDDALTLDELEWALGTIYGEAPEELPFEIIGFDACMMATVETADTVKLYAKYMIASQEDEPLVGWNYAGLMEALDPVEGINSAQVCISVCDSFAKACREDGSAGDITLSVIDLEEVKALITAYRNTGVELLRSVGKNDELKKKFQKSSKKAYNYGDNSLFSGYSNMVDLEDLIRRNEALLPETCEAVYSAIRDCVVYRIGGRLNDGASGLSCFHLLDYEDGVFRDYEKIAFSQPHIYLYEYLLFDSMSEEAAAFASNVEYVDVFADIGSDGTITSDETEFSRLEGYPIYINEDGYAILDVGKELTERLYGVLVWLAAKDPDTGVLTLLGCDNDYGGDWECGIFEDNFRGVWGSLDGHLAYMEIIYEADGYNRYIVPILLNGEDYSLHVRYEYDGASYRILGAKRGLDNRDMSEQGLRELKVGDSIILFNLMAQTMDDSHPSYTRGEAVTVTSKTEFYETELANGEYMYAFELIDSQGNGVLSEVVTAIVEDEGIWFDE